LASKWDYETAEIERLDEIKERLEAGEFVSQTEIADHFGVSPRDGR
jgi:DeoR/GlpR family transcriptional regulator of sugar metabolism